MKTTPAYRSLPARRSRLRSRPVRILTAVPICDGHDSAISTINLEFVRQGMEVIYLGYHRSVEDVVRAAIQEDVQGIGLSSYNGGHVEFFTEVLHGLRERHATDIVLFGGGGGTITPADASLMKRRGVSEIFFAGAPLDEMAAWVKSACSKTSAQAPRSGSAEASYDGKVAEVLTAAEQGVHPSSLHCRPSARVVGIAGSGGAGKSTLIDELALRFLDAYPEGRLAILSHDPGAPGRGALLGDRAAMVYAHDDRVFIRSLATGGRAGGLSPATRDCLKILRHAGFDLILVETAGIGQEDLPFARGLADRQVLVMSPDYGGWLQLQKILMLATADIVVVNKSDRPAAGTALAEVERRLSLEHSGGKVISTVAKRHRDPGVAELFRQVMP